MKLAEERLVEVEAALEQVFDQYRSVHLENVQLKTRIQELAKELEDLRRDFESRKRQLEAFGQQRLEIRKRLQRVRDHVGSLEQPG